MTMASSSLPQFHFSPRKVLVLYFVLFLFGSILVCAYSESQSQTHLPKKKTSSSDGGKSSKNQTKLIKSYRDSSKATQKTKVIQLNTDSSKTTQKVEPKKPNSTTATSTKTKLDFPNKTQTKKLSSTTKPHNSTKTQLKKLHSTSKLSNSTKLKKPKPISKSSNSTKTTSLNKKTQDLPKPTPRPKNKTTTKINPKTKNPDQKPKQPNRALDEEEAGEEEEEEEEEEDFISDFRDLPYKFQQTLIPDLEKLSTTSRAYLKKANREITSGFRPVVGKKYAPAIASLICFTFILIPLLLVSLLVNRIKPYFSFQKALIFIQAYLAIYFSILCLSGLVTGLEPLKFLFATSRPTYVCVQLVQTLGYVLYLLLLLMYLLLVFSTADTGLSSKLLGLGQALVGYAVGLHYYVAVFHRVLLNQPPKTNWKVHGVYATCFLLICQLAHADRRKKTCLEEEGEEGKKK